MVTNKRAKNSRQRGSKTHGCGSMKKRRGKGHKGGAGMAGTGKRASQKKPSIWKNKKYFGKYGFKKKGIIEKIKPINLDYFEQKTEKLFEKKKIEKQGDVYVIDLKKLGYNKLLGSGNITKKLKITSPSFSKKAEEKIKNAGGEVVKPAKKEKPQKEQKSSDEKAEEKQK
ncbi:50S ribosomal protein L15 [Candidatus Woesearchaeota archaeon]|nr:50S ribosomal protein L15 [Candidatus Woesearchaeota archaeon]